MSLCAWFPLIGTLDNQGTDNVSFTTTGTSWTTDGKLGKCLKLGYSSDFTIPSLVKSKQISIAYWLRVNTATSTQWLDPIHYYTNPEGGTGAGWVTRQELYSNCTLTGFWFDNGSVVSIPITVGQWAHFAITVDYEAGIAKVYKDGVLQGTSTSVTKTTQVTGNNFRIGENGLDLSENDVRIYNHILSPKEIEILARGLVLHYPLSLAQANMLKTTPRSYNAGSYQAYAINLTENMVAGQQYTIQFWDVDISHTGKSSSELSVYVYWGGGRNGECSFSIPSGHADHLVKTFTAQSGGSASDANNLWLNIYNSVPSKSGTMNMKIGHWKMEKGSVATTWIPSSADSDYSSLDTEYDVSGNKYHATIIGTVERNSNTARYSTCTGFSNNTYESVSITPGDMASRFTFAWWAKYTLYSAHMFWGFANGNRLNLFMNNTFCWNTGDGANNTFGVSASTYADNNWHHFAVTGDGTTVKLYIDGEFKANAKTFKGVTGTTLIFNGWNTNNDYNFNGNLSDFRLYATCLSAEDIQKLYSKLL